MSLYGNIDTYGADTMDDIQSLDYKPFKREESLVGILSSWVDKGVDTYAQVENVKARVEMAKRPLERQNALFNNPRLTAAKPILSPEMKRNLMIGGGVVVGLLVLSKVF